MDLCRNTSWGRGTGKEHEVGNVGEVRGHDFWGRAKMWRTQAYTRELDEVWAMGWRARKTRGHDLVEAMTGDVQKQSVVKTNNVIGFETCNSNCESLIQT